MARLQTIGDRIKYLLEQKGITQADLVKAAGLEATGVPVKHEPSVPEPSIVHGGVSPGDLVVATIGTVPYLVVIHKRL